jgi:hypothetical protein
MTWKQDPRTLKPFGSFTLVSEVNKDRETAHLVTFPDGKQIRVLPSGWTGAYRAGEVASALHDLNALETALGPDFGHLVDAVALFGGLMRKAAIVSELVSADTFERFLGEFLDERTVAVLVDAMPEAGWKVEKA